MMDQFGKQMGNYGKNVVWIILAVLILLLIGRKSSVTNAGKTSTAPIQTFKLLGDAIYPEGICINKHNGAIYTGSIHGRGIQKTLRGKTDYFLKPGTALVAINMLGMPVDHPNNRLWVCSNDLKAFFENGQGKPTLSVFDTQTGKRIQSIEKKDFSSDFTPLFGDVVTDREGNAYVTNLASTAIVRVSKDFSEIQVWEDFPKAPDEKFYILNGLDINSTGEYLVVASYKTGYEQALATLFKVDTKTGGISTIDCSDSVQDFIENGIDGLSFLNDTTLLGVCGNGKLLKISLLSNQTKAIITDISTGTEAASVLNEPSTLALYNGKVYTTNSQANRYFAGNLPTLPFKITEIPFGVLGIDK